MLYKNECVKIYEFLRKKCPPINKRSKAKVLISFQCKISVQLEFINFYLIIIY